MIQKSGLELVEPLTILRDVCLTLRGGKLWKSLMFFLKKNVKCLSDSPYAYPLVFVKKKSGDGKLIIKANFIK